MASSFEQHSVGGQRHGSIGPSAAPTQEPETTLLFRVWLAGTVDPDEMREVIADAICGIVTVRDFSVAWEEA